MKILCRVFELVFILVFIAGFICFFSEVTPWSMGSQIKLFLAGFGLMFVGFLGCAFFEGLGGKTE